MAANVNRADGGPKQSIISFIEQNSSKVAFLVSACVQAIFSPLFFFLGTVSGLLLHHSVQPELKLREDEPVISIAHTVLAVVGATATLVSLLPAAASAGFVFQSIPFICSMSFGSTIYRAFKS